LLAGDVPPAFELLRAVGAFVDDVGPLYVRTADGALGLRVDDRHLNLAGTAMGGLLASLVDAAFGRAIRAEADGDAAVATVSLTTDYLRPAAPGAWLQAHARGRAAHRPPSFRRLLCARRRRRSGSALGRSPRSAPSIEELASVKNRAFVKSGHNRRPMAASRALFTPRGDAAIRVVSPRGVLSTAARAFEATKHWRLDRRTKHWPLDRRSERSTGGLTGGQNRCVRSRSARREAMLASMHRVARVGEASG
jgi:uncharacterized protein (TIGR00369 family)